MSILIWTTVALLFLTFVTVAVMYIDVGEFNIVIAIGIAVLKETPLGSMPRDHRAEILDSRTLYGFTPYMLACECGNLDAVQRLVDVGFHSGRPQDTRHGQRSTAPPSPHGGPEDLAGREAAFLPGSQW